MRVLINLGDSKLVGLQNYRGAVFSSLFDPDALGDVAVVVRGTDYDHALDVALQADRPVVVVAGTAGDTGGERCIDRAQAAGIPDECVIAIIEGQVATLDGSDIAPAVGKRIGAGALLKVVKQCVDEDLRPDPVIWDGSVRDAVNRKTKQPAPQSMPDEPVTGRWVSSFEDLLKSAEKVIAVFRSTANARSNQVAATLADRLNGVHVELSAAPWVPEGLETTLDSGRYIHTDGSALEGTYNGAGCLVVEVDPAVPDSRALELAYETAAGVIHVVDADEPDQGKAAIEAWLKSGWMLDAIVPDDPAAAGVFRKYFKDLVQSNLDGVIQKLVD